MRSIPWVRVGLLYQAVFAAMVGLWALPAPKSFYDNFPGGGMHWADVSGPYNEHYIRDVGALYVGFLVLFVWALARPNAVLITAVAAAWAVVQAPHVVYHLAHDEGMPRGEWLVQSAGLVTGLVIAVALVVAGRRLSAPAGSAAR